MLDISFAISCWLSRYFVCLDALSSFVFEWPEIGGLWLDFFFVEDIYLPLLGSRGRFLVPDICPTDFFFPFRLEIVMLGGVFE